MNPIRHPGRWLTAAFASLSLSAAFAQQPPATLKAPEQPLPDNVLELRTIGGEAYVAGDYSRFLRAMQKLHALRPYNAEYMVNLVAAHALLDQPTPAYSMMLQMQQMGLSYDFDDNPNTESIRGTEAYEYVNDLMVRAGQPVGDAEPAFRLDDDVILPEALAWDPTRERFLVGSVANGHLRAISRKGRTRTLLEDDAADGPWGIFDIVVDADRNRLWLTSASVPDYAGNDASNNGRSALFEYALDSLELIRQLPAPADDRPHALANIAQAPNGDLYIADGAMPLIYHKPAAGDRLRPFIAASTLTSLRGMAVSDDGERLYVADYELGVIVVDLGARKATDLRGPDTLNLGGIDGLYLWDDNLVVIQNMNRPERVMRLTLDDSGTEVTAVSPVAVAMPEFDAPTYGTLLGSELYFFANSHWASPPGQRRPVTVMRADVSAAPDIVPVDEQKFWEEYEERKAREAEAEAAGG